MTNPGMPIIFPLGSRRAALTKWVADADCRQFYCLKIFQFLWITTTKTSAAEPGGETQLWHATTI